MSLGNFIRMSTESSGQGSLTLISEPGYADVLSQIPVGVAASYVIHDGSGHALERGIGYHDGLVWVRDKVAATLVGGVYTGANPLPVDLPAGTKYLIISPGAQSVITSRPGVWAATNKCYGEQAVASAAGSLTLVADRAYAIPAVCAVDSDIDAVIFRVGTAATAGKQAKGAIFSFGSDGLPGVMLAEGAAVAVDSAGTKVSTFGRFRPPPVYFMCLLSDGTPTVTSYGSGILMSNAMGCDASLTMTSYIHHNGASGLTFPAPWTPVANASNAQRPALFVRCP